MSRLDRIEVGEADLLALAPWTVVGASAYAVFQVERIAAGYGDLVWIPAAYLGTALLAGAAWLAADRTAPVAGRSAPELVAAAGGVAALVAVGAVLSTARGGLRLAWPAGGVLASVVATALVWAGIRRGLPDVAAATGRLGALAVFGHVLDGVLTAIGIDVLGFGERTTLSRWVIEFAAGLPTADLLGSGWLFVVVKLALATGVVWLLAPTVEEDPTYGRVLLAVVAAVGLGPGLHNTLLFVVA